MLAEVFKKNINNLKVIDDREDVNKVAFANFYLSEDSVDVVVHNEKDDRHTVVLGTYEITNEFIKEVAQMMVPNIELASELMKRHDLMIKRYPIHFVSWNTYALMYYSNDDSCDFDYIKFPFIYLITKSIDKFIVGCTRPGSCKVDCVRVKVKGNMMRLREFNLDWEVYYPTGFGKRFGGELEAIWHVIIDQYANNIEKKYEDLYIDIAASQKDLMKFFRDNIC